MGMSGVASSLKRKLRASVMAIVLLVCAPLKKVALIRPWLSQPQLAPGLAGFS
jgi:hypothetical protein